ncbi:hypothetical protein RN001_001893 [Aquatica leii]|uniref:Retrotransposon gag domain-containing protein n=1 Tax=Aquatica leii TaxID=1421715 RepID=A0AAN7Q864_9COLE|nr:hypothetical protein RN001_001893 [Aquatica leii]
MDVERLLVDEVEWELHIRGITCEGPIADKRKLLRARLRVENFLERIEELRVSRGVSKDQLFLSAVEFFSGNALIWYRSIRDNVHNWNELEHALRRTFLPCDYENSLWDEIRNRTQGDNEPVAIYIAIMENLFKRFSSVPSEITRLSVIKGNLQPYLQSQLTLQLICSISELTRTCRLLEDSQVRTNKFKPPPTKP